MLGVVAEVDLLARLVDVGHVLLREVGRRLERDDLFDVLDVLGRRDGEHTLLDRPEEEDGRLVDTARLGDALENRLERTAGLVAEDRGEGAVRAEDDAVLALQLLEALKVGEDVWVVLDLWALACATQQWSRPGLPSPSLVTAPSVRP